MNSYQMQFLKTGRKVRMKNKVFTVTIFNGKTVRIIKSHKLQTYFVELNDLKRLLELSKNELPVKYHGNLNYIEVKMDGKVKKVAGVAVEDMVSVKNFSKSKDADNYIKSILAIIEDIKLSYSGYTRGMRLDQTEQDDLIGEIEESVRKINFLEGQVDALRDGAKSFLEFTGNTTMIPLRRVHEHLKYKTTFDQLLGHLRQSGAIDEYCRPTPSLIEKGCFRVFMWSTQIGDKEKKTTQIVVSEKGIKYINEILEKANGKVKKK